MFDIVITVFVANLLVKKDELEQQLGRRPQILQPEGHSHEIETNVQPKRGELRKKGGEGVSKN